MTTVEINHNRHLSISRNNSTKITPSNYIITTSFMIDHNSSISNDNKPLVGKGSPISLRRFSATRSGVSKLFRSFLTVISLPTFQWLSIPSQLSLTPSVGRKVTGTLFGNRRGHVSFAVQCNTRSVPILIIEMAVSTAALVKEMSSGLVRIALECEKRVGAGGGGGGKLLNEPVWTMYCNGRKCGYAVSKACSESEWRVLRMVESVSVGAGVIPVVEDGGSSGSGGGGGGGGGGGSEGELVYMRARFERVVGSRDSEAYYMMNPDRTGGPELSIFMLRI